MEEFAAFYSERIEESLKQADDVRDGKWAEGVAVGSESFVTDTREMLGFKERDRVVSGRDGAFELGECVVPYNGILGHKNAVLNVPIGIHGTVFYSISV
jgi:putative transposase